MSDGARLERERRRLLAAYARRAEIDAGPWFGREDAAHVLRLHERYRATQRRLAAAGFGPGGRALAACSALDVGCGRGDFLVELATWGLEPERLAGLDLRPEAVARARALLPAVDLRVGCAGELPWSDESFDLVFLNTVLSSILEPEMRRAVAAEALRALRPGGAAVVYDTFRRNPHNPDVAPVTAAELRELFAGREVEVRTLTFLPHVARRLPPRLLELLYPLLAAVPGWQSHLLAVIH